MNETPGTRTCRRRRTRFDHRIGRVRHLQQRGAGAWIQAEPTRPSAPEAARRPPAGPPATQEVAAGTFSAAEGGHPPASPCQHLHGGIGIDVDYPLHRYFNWALQIEHELGSARHQLERLGRAIARGAVAELAGERA